jgi:hypothetical protein
MPQNGACSTEHAAAELEAYVPRGINVEHLGYKQTMSHFTLSAQGINADPIH